MHKLIILVGAVCTMPAFAADAVKIAPGAQRISTDGGRFVFGQVSEMRKDQFMLDTKTGKMWRIVYAPYKNAKGEDIPGETYPILEPVLYEDTKGARSVEPR